MISSNNAAASVNCPRRTWTCANTNRLKTARSGSLVRASDIDTVTRRVRRGVDVAVLQRLSRNQRRQQAGGRGIRCRFEQMQPARQPTAATRPFSAIEQVEHEPKHAASSALQIVGVQPLALCAFPQLRARLFATREIRRDGLALEIDRVSRFNAG
jgi:hypothetical protein